MIVIPHRAFGAVVIARPAILKPPDIVGIQPGKSRWNDSEGIVGRRGARGRTGPPRTGRGRNAAHGSGSERHSRLRGGAERTGYFGRLAPCPGQRTGRRRRRRHAPRRRPPSFSAENRGYARSTRDGRRVLQGAE